LGNGTKINDRVDVRLANDQKQALKLAALPNYETKTIFNENLKRTKLMYNKSIDFGVYILDLSKTLMYDFHYTYMKIKFGDDAKQLFADTDSLAYKIKTEDFYTDIKYDIDSKFDTSDYSKDHLLFSTKNKKVIGMIKDEAYGK